MSDQPSYFTRRFNGYLPVVIDVETAGFHCETDALLEIAAITLTIDEDGKIHPCDTYAHHILPFNGANLDPKALEFTGIDPYHPFRFAVSEKKALKEIFTAVNQSIAKYQCRRSILVGHNAAFDLGFLNAAVQRCQLKYNPFHHFTTFDTASLAALAYGETVLAKAMIAADIEFDPKKAHSAIYDAEKTAALFCKIVNTWQALSGKSY